jgi:lipooligosaccharide transport system permease protein
MYYFTLFITPMLLVSGVFFPADQLPAALHTVASWLPLSHAVQLARPLLLGEIPANAIGHVAALLGIAVVAFSIATVLTRRRLLK